MIRSVRCGWLLAALACAACDGNEPQPLARTGRLGSLRDLVLFERAAAAGGSFFLDRFEATRGDWAEFAVSPEGQAAGAQAPKLEDANDAALPMASIDLPLARAFARWRCARLPRADEWWFAATADGRYQYPWGDNDDAARANTHELGLGRAAPVGTFESGRASATAPYDLVGNVAEWSESVPAAWYRTDADGWSSAWTARRWVLASPALTAWAVPGRALSPHWLVQAAGERVPHEVLGGDFASRRRELVGAHAPRDRADTVGLRLCAAPGELLRWIAARRSELTADDRRQLTRFLARTGHREALCAALAAVDAGERATREFWQGWLP